MSAMPAEATRRISLVMLSMLLAVGVPAHPATAGVLDELPNNFPFLNEAGTAATFSTAGVVDLGNAFHVPQGSNGRSCESCHLVQSGWSIRPADVELKFLLTRGTDPIFNLLDANSPNADVSTPAARRASYSMLRKGLFRRGGAVPTDAEYEVIAVDDPLGSGGSRSRFTVFRRPLATANFHIATNVGWHDQDTNGGRNVHAGLTSQATNNILGAQEGSPPVDPDIVQSIVTYEEGLRFAQQSVFGLGLLTTCGGQGGPENLSAQPVVRGRFTLYDAWIGLIPGSCTSKSADRKRAQIARGQELFNRTKDGRSCNGCHNASNNGSNVAGTLFDVGASAPELRTAEMPVYTLRNKTTLIERATTDPGRALRSGHWDDIDRFKTPSLRGLAARAPYFHNGIAPTLKDVVRHYEAALDFEFTREERDDLVAFLEAL
jgi:cytochrome c peroxidase